MEQGIITPVSFADWAAPIVPVLKSDKQSVRICGDFKRMVNQASKVDKYPIPKMEDLLHLDMSKHINNCYLTNQAKS